MEPASGKEKGRVGRRRIACIACSSNKQKCDGATRHPCRRCELYSVTCEYPDGQVPRGAVRVNTGLHSNSNGGTDASSSTSSAIGLPTVDTEATETTTLLREIKDRLAAIESGLDSDRRQGGRSNLQPTLPNNNLLLPATSPRTDTQRPLAPPSTAQSDVASNALEQMDMPHDSNPLQVLVATLDEVERLNRGDQAMEEERDSDARGSSMGAGISGREGESNMQEMSEEEQLVYQARRTPRSNRPDVLSRGLMTVEDLDLAFSFYRQRVQPWIPVIEERNPLVVRAKSPFLFHAILLVTDYYNTSTSPRAIEVYNGLTSIVNEWIASLVFAGDHSVFTSDLVKGLLLLLYYKPVQIAFYQQRGIKSNSRIAHASKVNALASIMIHSLLRTTASFLNLQQAPTMLHMYFDNAETAAKAGIPSYEDVIADYRLWVSLIAVDNLGSLQSGRASWADPTSALRVGRKFANLQSHPTDVRRTAVLELYSIIAVPPSSAATTRPVRYRLERLPQINTELEKWRAHWAPLLNDAQRQGDPLAYTVERTLACFVSLSVNGATFSRWSLERQKERDEGKEGRPKLTAEDWSQLQTAADAAQSAIYAVSLEAQDSFKILKRDDWPRVNGSRREPLQLSLAVAEDFKTALDTITCIAFAYSLLFLVRMSSAGLVSCNIVSRQAEYESGADLVPQPLTTGDKLPLLLELGSKFLHAISPSPDHPAEKHSILIQTILQVGLGEHQSASSSNAMPPSSLFDQSTESKKPSNETYSFAPSPLSSSTQPRSTHPIYDSWMWDTRDTTATSSNGANQMRSLVMPNLVDSNATPIEQPSVPSTSTSFDDNAIGRSSGASGIDGEDPAKAMASLLASSNPFLGFDATQSTLNSGFNADFGLTGSNGVDGVADLDWTTFGDLGGMAGSSSWMGL